MDAATEQSAAARGSTRATRAAAVAEEETDRHTRTPRSDRRSTTTSATGALGTDSSFSEADTLEASSSPAAAAASGAAAASSQQQCQNGSQHIDPDADDDVIQTPDERLSIKLQAGGQSLHTSNVSGISTSGHEYRRTSSGATGADIIEEEHDENEDENEDQQNQRQIEAEVSAPAVEETSPSAGVGGEASTAPSACSISANTNDAVDLERADGSGGTIAQGSEEEPPSAESATVLDGASVVLVATSHSDSQEHPPELPPPADDSPATSIALEAYTAEEVEYAKVVGETDVACMALRTKRAMCVIGAFVLVVVAAVVAGVITTQPKGDDGATQQAGPIDKIPITQDNIKIAVNYWIADPEATAKQYGHISTWDTSSVTSLAELFQNYGSFNEDLSAWNTSAVETMSQVFGNAKSFNSDISGWDTSKVRTMEGMFRGASSFDGDLSSWDTGNVQRMNSMFNGAVSFTATLCWDLRSITTATQFEHGFGECKTSNIKTCHMLCNSGARLDPSCATFEMIEAAQECPTPG